MKEIKLSRGLVTLVDDLNYEILNQDKWHATSGRIYYAARATKGNRSNRKLIFMHRCILGYPPIGEEIDHINGDGLDNRLMNLRFVTRRQNQQNRHTYKSSQYPGVSWRKETDKWRARISIDGEVKVLGCFLEELEAAQAYQRAVEYLGETVI